MTPLPGSGMLRALPRGAMLAWLLADHRRSAGAIRRIQERKLRRIVAHAGRCVSFYRQKYRAAGVDPAAIRTVADLALLPMVSKQDILARPLAEVLAAGIDPRDCVSASSSGSSGSPLTAYWLPDDRAAMNLGWKRAYMAAGMAIGDRLAAFTGRGQCEPRHPWRERAGIFPRLEISSRLEPRQWTETLRDWRPQAISGSVMTLRLLAEHLDEQGITDVRPRFVFNSSELMGIASRQLLSRVFGCPVIDIYGSEEAGCIAWECPACAGYHLAGDMLIVELLKDGRTARPGEDGEVVVTNLHSRAMPFIRYRQGDVVRVASDPPRCGSPFPLISLLEGRDEDFLVLNDGQRLPPPPFYHCLDPRPWIRRWRIRQEMAGSMRVELVVTADFSADRLQELVHDLNGLTGGRMAVSAVVVDAIPVVADAKFQAITSRPGKWLNQ
jgi:phenylacetate-CoA ligase